MMKTEEEQIQEQISDIWGKIDTFLANYNNSLLLFDFTTVSHYANGGIKIKSIYQYKIKDYPDQLDEYFNKHGYSIPPTASNDDPTLYKVESYQEPQTLIEPIFEIYDPKTVTDTTIVGLETWHRFVEEKKIAGQSLTLFKDFINDVETKERIEVGVYVLLKNQFSSDEDANKRITDFISFEIYKFLYGRGREYFIKEYKEKFKQLEKLKTQTMFSLTTHSLKTHLETTVIPTKKSFDDKLNCYPDLKEDFKEHSREVDTLFHLTTLLSLIDKIDNPEEFKEAATKVLFSEEKSTYNLKKHLESYNSRHGNIIEISPEIEQFDFSITIYGLFFGDKLLELFFNTLFENIYSHGAYCEDNKKVLNITINDKGWKFTNNTVEKTVEIDAKNLKGNLGLFKKLIEETKSGTFSTTPGDSKFEIEIKKN